MVKNRIYDLPIDGSPFLISEWDHHDFRRYHLTEVALAWGEMRDVATVHGQGSVDTAKRYFQWGLAMKRKAKTVEFKLNI